MITKDQSLPLVTDIEMYLCVIFHSAGNQDSLDTPDSLSDAVGFFFFL